MAAIHGIRYTGFIGEVYKQFPFPKREAEFKQKPEGFQNRAWMIALLERWAVSKTIPVRVDRQHETVSIGEYLFTREVFHQLIQYVWRGGYPRWRDEIRPDYVMEMKFGLKRAATGSPGAWSSPEKPFSLSPSKNTPSLAGRDKKEGEESLSKIQRALGLLQCPAPDGVGVNHGRLDVAVKKGDAG